jgi:2-phospho-L-lactate guanylyltransferase (CobY/MobA/RfbA family)
VLHLPGSALDVDNPEDLHRLLAVPGETLTQSLLRRWSLGSGVLSSGTEGA